MKKEILTCDVCGSIIDGPGVDGRMGHDTVSAAIMCQSGKDLICEIDVCEDHTPWDLFDDGSLRVVFGGSRLYEGEMIDLQDWHAIAVLEYRVASATSRAYSINDLSKEQREYVEQAAAALVMRNQKELNEMKHNL